MNKRIFIGLVASFFVVNSSFAMINSLNRIMNENENNSQLSVQLVSDNFTDQSCLVANSFSTSDKLLSIEEGTSEDWKGTFNKMLPLLGHRNWVLIVDAAYPLQSSKSITTVISNESITEVAEYVLTAIKRAPHVSSIVHIDAELNFLDDSLAPGIETLKKEYKSMLKGSEVQQIPHVEVFSKLDKASQLFSVFAIKTNCLLPYSSMFIELDCGYWETSQEKILQERLK